MLLGTSALIVEEEFLIALEVQRVLKSAGADEAQIARNVEDARECLLERQYRLAVVAIGPCESEALPFCRELQRKAIAVVVSSADVRHRKGIPGLDGVEVIVKPFADDQLLAACMAALLGSTRPSDSVR